MSLSYGVINPHDYYDEMGQQFNCVNQELKAEDANAVLHFLNEEKANIELITMRNCKLGDDFCARFVEVLEDNATLRVLRLEENRIGDEGATALAQALMHNETLEVLVLADNQIGVDAKMILKDAWEENRPAANLMLN